MSESRITPTRFDADLISLRALVAIADSGSFSSAARQIGRTQSAVSLQIAKLEERLDVRLLERTSRSVHTTSAGETLIAYARRIISLADEAVGAVTAHTHQTALRLGMDDCHDRDSILDSLKQLNEKAPLTPLQIHFDHIDALLTALQADELDLVVGHALVGQTQARHHRGFDRTLLLDEPLVWVGSSERLGRQRPLPLVLPKAHSAIRQATLDTLNGFGIASRVTTECNSVPALQSAVRAGLGLAALPLSALGDGMIETSAGLPDLPASALFVEVPASDKHPCADLIVEQLIARGNVSPSRASASDSADRSVARTCAEARADPVAEHAPLQVV